MVKYLHLFTIIRLENAASITKGAQIMGGVDHFSASSLLLAFQFYMLNINYEV